VHIKMDSYSKGTSSLIFDHGFCRHRRCHSHWGSINVSHSVADMLQYSIDISRPSNPWILELVPSLLCVKLNGLIDPIPTAITATITVSNAWEALGPFLSPFPFYSPQCDGLPGI
jgi:hypothetical protein